MEAGLWVEGQKSDWMTWLLQTPRFKGPTLELWVTGERSSSTHFFSGLKKSIRRAVPSEGTSSRDVWGVGLWSLGDKWRHRYGEAFLSRKVLGLQPTADRTARQGGCGQWQSGWGTECVGREVLPQWLPSVTVRVGHPMCGLRIPTTYYYRNGTMFPLDGISGSPVG